MDEHESAPSRVDETLREVTDSWNRALGHFSTSVVEANRAVLAAFGGPDAEGTAPSTASRPVEVDESSHRPPQTEEVAYRFSGWEFERTVDDPESLAVGDAVWFHKTITDDEIRAFAAITGDTNRLHLDDGYAAETRFGRRIAHGTLVAGLISAALARIPGLTIYLSQDLRFLNPVNVGDELTATCEIVEDLGESKYRLETMVERDADGRTIIDGEAVVLIDDAPEED